jgi:thiamine monophosphate kinase
VRPRSPRPCAPRRIPIHPAARIDVDAALDLALRGGEDYEILFAARPGEVDALLREFSTLFTTKITRIGRVERGAGVHIDFGGNGRRELKEWGFQHFGGANDS